MTRRFQWLGGSALLLALVLTPGVGEAKKGGSFTPSANANPGPSASDIAKQYLTRSLAVRVVRLCNDDGSDPGYPSLSHVNNGIQEANEVLYDNSGAKLLFHLDPETDLSTCVQSTLTNYDCHLNPDYFPGKAQTEITAADLEMITEKDLNQDGQFDKFDTQHLCDTSQQGIRRKSIAYDYVGSMVVFVRGLEARRRVKYDDDLGHWVFAYPSGGYSSCAGNLIVMNSGWWGNLLAHEAGHYLCTPHTFRGGPEDVAAAADTIVAVADKYNLDPTDHETVLTYAFDGDYWSKIDFLGDHRILDTPPDPRGTLWKTVFGADRCLPENDVISVPVPEFGETYDLEPDRSLIMSYFKGCTALGQHFSPDQVDRIELALDHHRRHLVSQDVVDCYYAKYDATDWDGMEPWEAFAQKDFYLGACQGKLDVGALGRLKDKKFYPLPKPGPIPYWSDVRTRTMLEVLDAEEIQEEIDLDLAPQPRVRSRGRNESPALKAPRFNGGRKGARFQ